MEQASCGSVDIKRVDAIETTVSVPGWCQDIVDFDRIGLSEGLLRADELVSSEQAQTKEAFGFKWSKRETFESVASLSRMRKWLIERYGAPEKYLSLFSERPIVLDAGCGAGMSALEYWDGYFDKIHYLGVDISTAVDVCKTRMFEKGIVDNVFMQANIQNLPIADNAVDIIFSEGVMHHTDSTQKTFLSLSRHLKVNGLFMFYIYNKKGPIREFADDYMRSKLQAMSPEEGWKALEPLTQLGKLLGELNITINIPESIDLLEIPSGEIDLQRLFYWHIFKAYYAKELTLEEMNHINYDWYAPANAHRHTIDEVQDWCSQADMMILHQVVEPAGITIVARKNSFSAYDPMFL